MIKRIEHSPMPKALELHSHLLTYRVKKRSLCLSVPAQYSRCFKVVIYKTNESVACVSRSTQYQQGDLLLTLLSNAQNARVQNIKETRENFGQTRLKKINFKHDVWSTPLQLFNSTKILQKLSNNRQTDRLSPYLRRWNQQLKKCPYSNKKTINKHTR